MADSPVRLRDVLPAAAVLLGVSGAPDAPGLVDRFGTVRRVALVLVDGLGAELLPQLAHRAPLLASAASSAVRLRCGFPSTTPTSLVTLGTGADPGAHGVLGFTVAVPGTDRVLTHIRWRDDPPPRQWQPLPTWFDRIVGAGLEARVVLPEPLLGSGLTDAAYRGATWCGYGREDDPAAALLRALTDGAGLAYGYVSVLDTAAHRFGVGSPQWLDAAAAVDGYLRQVREGLPADAVLLVTADHGGLNLDPAQVHDIDREPALAAGLRAVAGEVRARYLHVRPGATADVLAAWRDTLGVRADVVERDEAVAAGWFGDPDSVPAGHRERIGDVVVSCRAAAGVLATAHEPPEVTALVGVHGGRTGAETAIPLLAFAG